LVDQQVLWRSLRRSFHWQQASARPATCPSTGAFLQKISRLPNNEQKHSIAILLLRVTHLERRYSAPRNRTCETTNRRTA
jgi:hypothetical protein